MIKDFRLKNSNSKLQIPRNKQITMIKLQITNENKFETLDFENWSLFACLPRGRDYLEFGACLLAIAEAIASAGGEFVCF